jgi:hypothetical protein
MLLDNFLPAYDFNEVHSININASPDTIMNAVKALPPSEISSIFRILFAIRELPARLMGNNNPTLLDAKPLLDQMFDNDFFVLAETKEEFVFGAIGQFWELSGGKSVVVTDPQEFLEFDQPDYAKVVANFFISPHGGRGDFRVTTETRIHIAEPKTRRKFATYWWIIYPGSAWIRQMWLKSIKRRAERR